MAVRGDKLVWVSSAGAELSIGQWLGTIPGVRIVAAAGRCGRGVGRLKGTADGLLSWLAPRSTAYGAAVDVSGGGDFVLYDGVDPDCWLAVHVTFAAWAGTLQVSEVHLDDRYNNAACCSDVSAASSVVLSALLGMRNDSGETLTNVVAWVDTTSDGLSVGADVFSLSAAKSADDAIAAFGTRNVADGDTLDLVVQRELGSSSIGSARQAVLIHVGFDDGDGGRAYTSFRGLFRRSATPCYCVYRRDGTSPIVGVDDPWYTAASLPAESPEAIGDGDWYIGVTYRSTYGLESWIDRVRRVHVSSGALLAERPEAPELLQLRPAAGGVVKVEALYRLRPGQAAATHWAIWWTDDGSTPGGGAADATVAVRFAGSGVALLLYDLPAVADGDTLKVLVRMRNGSTDSSAGLSAELLVDAAGPSAPPGASGWRGGV